MHWGLLCKGLNSRGIFSEEKRGNLINIVLSKTINLSICCKNGCCFELRTMKFTHRSTQKNGLFFTIHLGQHTKCAHIFLLFILYPHDFASSTKKKKESQSIKSSSKIQFPIKSPREKIFFLLETTMFPSSSSSSSWSLVNIMNSGRHVFFFPLASRCFSSYMKNVL